MFCLAVPCEGGIETGEAAAGTQASRPRLLVLLVFDQLRPDYLTRWQELYQAGGFKRLMQEGAWYTNCLYPYSNTMTAAGHASVVTGCSPERHGVIANEWWDRASWKEQYCVADSQYRAVPAGSAKMGVSPESLLAETLADVLKSETGGKAKVVALSGKDRASVLPGGKRPDAAYWFDDATGLFVTSTYYRPELHDWVAAFNAEGGVNRWFTSGWSKFRQDVDYERFSGPDDAEGEGTGAKQGKTFPHAMTGGLEQPGKASFKATYSSPLLNELLWELGQKAIETEGLGRDEVPDLLSISFSSNDVIGHAYGPDSQEVLDVTLRSDALIGDILNYLDKNLGPGRYAIAVTSDHGVCPLPEQARRRGIATANRIDPAGLERGAIAFLEKSFGKAPEGMSWIGAANFDIYVNDQVIDQKKLNRSEVHKALAAWFKNQTGIQEAYTRAELMDPGALPGDETAVLARRSYHPERSGDIFIVLEPYCLSSEYPTGTTHGTPHEYDRRVPLLFFGCGVVAGKRTEPVTPMATATGLSGLAGIRLPGQAEVPVPEGLIARP
jgi:predicted AlkP superfamily pyrophosphatase or phosphodiesterase